MIHAAQRLTAQSLKFRVSLSSLGAENVRPGAAQSTKAYLSWVRGGKTINTAPAPVSPEGTVEWRGELTQIVTIFFQFEDGNLQPAKKEYSIKVKDASTRKTLGKVKVDIRPHCKFESFSRSFLELETKTGIKVFLVISAELVDKEAEDAGASGSPASTPSPSDTRRALSATYASTTLRDMDQGEGRGGAAAMAAGHGGSGQGFSQSMHEFSPVSAEDGASVDPDVLIQQSIEILHSSSDSEDGRESNWQTKLQALARRLTPNPKVDPAAQKAAHHRRHTIAAGAPVPVSAQLFQSGEEGGRDSMVSPASQVSEASANPFGPVSEDDAEPGEDGAYFAAAGAHSVENVFAAATPLSAKKHAVVVDKLSSEIDLLKSQCSQLQEENAMLKQRLEASEENMDAVAKLTAENLTLRKKVAALGSKGKSKGKGKEASGEGEGGGKKNVAKKISSQEPLASPVKTDMIAELITTKMKLAEAQSTLDELKKTPSG